MTTGAATGLRRRDAAKLAEGRARFTDELAPRDLLHAAVLRSPHAHARVVSLDAARARALPGVAAVLGAADAPALLPRVARYVGEPLALAAADDAELARRACEAVLVEFEPLPARLDAEAALAAAARSGSNAEPAAQGSRPRSERRTAAVEAWAPVVGSCEAGHGDVDAALARAESVHAASYHLPFAPGAGAEPPVVLAWLDEDRRLVVRTSTRAPFAVRRGLAARLGLPLHRLRVTAPRVGSAERGGDATVEALAARLALATGRPVRLAVARDDELATLALAPAHAVHVRSAWSAGRLAGLDVEVVIDAGALPDEAGPLGGAPAPVTAALAAAARHALGLYPCPAARVRAHAARTNRPPAVLSSDSGAAGVLLALECHVDEVAAARGEDPLALRRRLLSAGTADAGCASPARLATLLARAAEALDDASGDDRRGDAQATRPALRRGLGAALAFRAAPSAGDEPRAASIEMNEDGSIRLRVGNVDAGSGSDTTLAQVAADALGVPGERVASSSGDTDTTPIESDAEPSFARAASAVAQAARALRARLVAQAARRLGCEAADLRVGDGVVSSADGRALSFSALARLARLEGDGEPFAVTATSGGAAHAAHACVLAEVEVDVETGELRVRRLVHALECGTLVSPAIATERAEGAALRALGRALAEQQSFDAAGRASVRSLRRLQPPRAGDAPAPLVVFATGDPEIKDVGDLAGRGVAAAVANALFHATGARVRELPLTPERVRAALQSRPSARLPSPP